MSEYRVEKHRAEAELTLSSGGLLQGWFFLAGSSATHAGPERVADVLNAETGFFPFQVPAGATPDTVLINRPQLISVRLLDETTEAQLEANLSLTTRPALSAADCVGIEASRPRVPEQLLNPALWPSR